MAKLHIIKNIKTIFYSPHLDDEGELIIAESDIEYRKGDIITSFEGVDDTIIGNLCTVYFNGGYAKLYNDEFEILGNKTEEYVARCCGD